MAATPITTEELRKSMRKSMSQRANFGSRGGGGSRRGSWASASIREVIGGPGGDVFQKSGRENDDDEEELKWAAIERLPTYDRMRKGIITQIMDDGRVVREEVDLSNLDFQNKKHLMQSILKVIEDDNERFLTRLRDRTDRVGIDIPKVEIRYEHLCVEGDAFSGSRALPTLLNSTVNSIEGLLGFLGIFPSKKNAVKILDDACGIVKLVQ